jgi:hypothetical protein
MRQFRLAFCMLSVVLIALELAVLRHFPNQALFAVGLTIVILILTRLYRLTNSEVVMLFVYATILTLGSMPSNSTNCGPIKIPIEQRTHDPMIHVWWWALLAPNIALMGLFFWANRLFERRKKFKRAGPIKQNGRDSSFTTPDDDLTAI